MHDEGGPQFGIQSWILAIFLATPFDYTWSHFNIEGDFGHFGHCHSTFVFSLLHFGTVPFSDWDIFWIFGYLSPFAVICYTIYPIPCSLGGSSFFFFFISFFINACAPFWAPMHDGDVRFEASRHQLYIDG